MRVFICLDGLETTGPTSASATPPSATPPSATPASTPASGNSTVIEKTAPLILARTRQLTLLSVSTSGSSIKLGPELPVDIHKRPDMKVIEIDAERVKSESTTFKGTDGKDLTQYQVAINDAAYKLCLKDPSLLSKKGDLLGVARKMLHESGYSYAKKRSRSVVVGQSASTSGANKQKRVRLTTDVRRKRIAAIEEDLEGLQKESEYITKARDKQAATRQYQVAAALTKELNANTSQRRKAQQELDALLKKDQLSSEYTSRVTRSKTDKQRKGPACMSVMPLKTFLQKKYAPAAVVSLTRMPDQQVRTPNCPALSLFLRHFMEIVSPRDIF